MSLAKDNPLNEMRELQSNEAPAFDDIYVPGIGVRGALSDDAAEGSDFQPSGKDNWTVPCAGPFTLLWTTVVTLKDLESRGTIPARGEMATPMATGT